MQREGCSLLTTNEVGSKGHFGEFVPRCPKIAHPFVVLDVRFEFFQLRIHPLIPLRS